MTEKLTREDVDTLIRLANSALPDVVERARKQLIDLSTSLGRLPDQASRAAVTEVVRQWFILPR